MSRRPCLPLGHLDPKAQPWCGACRAAIEQQVYRDLWGDSGGVVPAGQLPPLPAAPPPCIYLGKPTGEVRECESCGGRVRLKVMACQIHKECTVGRALAGLAFCGTCPDRGPAYFPTAPPRV